MRAVAFPLLLVVLASAGCAQPEGADPPVATDAAEDGPQLLAEGTGRIAGGPCVRRSETGFSSCVGTGTSFSDAVPATRTAVEVIVEWDAAQPATAELYASVGRDGQARVEGSGPSPLRLQVPDVRAGEHLLVFFDSTFATRAEQEFTWRVVAQDG